MKFSQMPYTRPELDAARARLEELIGAFETAAVPEESIDAFMAVDKYRQSLHTMASLAFIRHSLDTTDEFYDTEQSYFDETFPLLRDLEARFERAMLNNPHRAALESRFGGLMFKNIEISMRTFDPVITADLQRENKLTTEYDKLLASAQIEFDGKTLTLAQITPYLQEPDRGVRQAACNARSEWFLQRADKLDGLFDELTKLRVNIAKKLNYSSFIGLGYDRMTRNCYDSAAVASFREGVKRHIVPVAARLKREQAARIGVPKLTMYDDAFEFPTGNAKPFGTPEQIFEHGRIMYNELSPQTGEFMAFMLENELFDVLTRPGKSGGGYCADIPDYKSAFIFANFNGTSGDIDVLTHEAGHAFASYMGRDITPSPLREYTYETAEVHSMSMEFFTWPWMEGFFKEADKYRYSHLSRALTFIPYGTMVDEFQHKVYENPDMTARGRNELWRELESIYRPWLDLDDTPFFSEGRRWQYQAHIYERPFYYIDYCLAQTVALAFWSESRTAPETAWAKYLKFISFAGTKTFTQSVTDCSLPDPFVPDTIKGLADTAMKWLDTQPHYK